MTGMNIKDHWCSDGGAYWWHNNIAWGLQMAALKMKKENNLFEWGKIRLALENKSYLSEGIDTLKKYDPDSFCLLYTSPSPRDRSSSRMPSSA